MSTTTPSNLKISKKMAELLRVEIPGGETMKRIDAEQAAGRADKTGAVMVEVEHDNAVLMAGIALGRMGKLDAELAQAAPENKHKLLGEHSAWRALSRQLPDARKILQDSAKK